MKNTVMTEQGMVRLVLDTLYDLRRAGKSTCTTVNEAGMELLQSNGTVLPIIERVLRETVKPALMLQRGIPEGFLGLKYVLGAYLIVCARESPERSIAFLRQMPERLLIEAVSAISVFFRRIPGGYNFGVPPGREIKAFLRNNIDSNDVGLKEVSTRAYRNME